MSSSREGGSSGSRRLVRRPETSRASALEELKRLKQEGKSSLQSYKVFAYDISHLHVFSFISMVSL
jgi:hypothetical protein